MKLPRFLPRAAVVTLLLAAYGAVVFLLSVVLLWGLGSGLRLTFFSDRGPDRSTYAGFGRSSDRQSWTTTEAAAIALDDLDRSRDLTLTITASGRRPHVPLLTVRADGYQIGVRQLSRTWDTWTMTIPARRRDGLRLTLEVPDLYRANPRDIPRGALIKQLMLDSTGWWWPPIPVLVTAGVVGAALGAAFGLVGLPILAAILGLLVGGVVSAVVGHQGVAAVTAWNAPATTSAVAAFAGSVLFRLVHRLRSNRVPESLALDVGQYFVVSCALLWFNLLFWLNPETPAGDLIFHVNRFHRAMSGTYFFTEGTPGGWSPYAVGLYVIAGWFRQPTLFWQSGDALHVIAAIAESAASFLLACGIRRVWRAPATALLALVGFHSVSAEFQVHAIGYMTNAFAQPMSVLALAALTIAAPVIASACALPLTIVAFLSHTGAFITLSAIFLSSIVVLGLTRTSESRCLAVCMLIVLFVAWAVSIGLFYSHFGDVYRDLLTRTRPIPATLPVQRAEAHQTMWVPGWPALMQRLAAVPGYVQKYLGFPLIVLALAGLWKALRRTDVLTRLLQGWLAACLGLFVLGQISSIDVRYYLAAGPPLVVFAAAALVDAWTRPRLKWIGLALGVLVIAQSLSYRFDWFVTVPR
jgi:hypothetical protein